MKLRALIALLIGTLAITGCNDLVQTNPNEPTTGTFWENREDALQGINGTYNVLQAYFGTYKRWTFFVWDQRSDVSRSESPWVALSNVSKFQYNSYDFNANAQTWNDNYNGIFRANQVIQNVPDIDMDENLRQRIVAEAKFIRALMYYNLVVLYGGDIPAPLEPKSPDVLPETLPADSIWQIVERDLNDARGVLPPKGGYSESNEGRATQGAANALLGKAHLQQRDWEQAVTAFERVIGSGNYGLLNNYQDLFDATNENHRESVFEVQFSDDSRLDSGVGGDFRAQMVGPPILNFGDAQPTQWFFDQFFQEQTVNGNQDPRIDATFFYPGGPEMYGQTYQETYTDGRTEPYWKKYTEYYKDEQILDSEINKMVIRYAGVLLLCAEAHNEIGERAAAAAHIQRVRDRVNLPDRETEFANMSQSELREQIAHEQLLELGGENERIRFLLRHDMFESNLDELRAHDPEFSSYRSNQQLLPIPTTEVNLNPNVTQNEGW